MILHSQIRYVFKDNMEIEYPKPGRIAETEKILAKDAAKYYKNLVKDVRPDISLEDSLWGFVQLFNADIA